ncbi:hypothetical protein C7H19_23905 [Aphanothece hegewaldii CCALA 016]|uniref:Uncharacterized protein n=1 Tax=Aphanothece hegewaldii CCALA 016 TaxID=2107694 RepID=A0A2T1LR14_9CHRO|nr:hypothetical protein [Aphanothece hegewaldii]PSF30446.1 hypothetical protein C7H19_23905 [Aphanothece hegewaldii CCALA 016]
MATSTSLTQMTLTMALYRCGAATFEHSKAILTSRFALQQQQRAKPLSFPKGVKLAVRCKMKNQIGG